MEKRHPDIAEFGLLIPDVDHVVTGPHSIGFAQAQALTDPRHSSKADAILTLVSFVLNFDFNHFTDPLYGLRQQTTSSW